MENKENYIRKDIVKSVEKAIVEIFNCNNRSSDLSVVDVIEAAKELHNLNKAEEAELYLFVNNIKGLFAVHDTHYNYICSVFTDEKYNFTYINQTLSAIPIDLTYRMFFYSYNNEPLRFFKSYSSLYNYLHGDQNAYLSSKIEETGKDISMSIKDMDANLGDKMDTLIDTINSKKEGLSADELQNVIDKGLEDLNKNTEDIKDNTSDILDTLKEQNNILLQILGVTEYIAYQNDKYNNTYTKADMSNLFKKSFNRVCLVPEYHSDKKKFHFHALMSNLGDIQLVDSGRRKDKGTKIIYNIANYRLGFSTAIPVNKDSDSQGKIVGYMLKYITKDLATLTQGKKRYWYTRTNCEKPVIDTFLIENDKIKDFTEALENDKSYRKTVDMPFSDNELKIYNFDTN